MAVNEDFREKMIEKQERDTINRALGVKAQNLKTFAYFDNDRLTVQIYEIYPEATHLVIVNNDSRDANGFPTISSRQLRDRVGSATWSQGKRIIQSPSYNDFKIILCLVEHGQVVVKVITKDLGINRSDY